MEKGGKNIPNKGDSTLVKKTDAFCSQFCGQQPLVDNNKMFTELILYERHMAQYRACKRNLLSICGINKIVASYDK